MKSIKPNQIVQGSNGDRIQFNHLKGKNSGFSTSGINSNTGGQPSPIISTKRVPQKFLNNGDRDDTSPADPRFIEI